MTIRSIETAADLEAVMRLLATRKLPFTVEIVNGRRRSTEQNRLQRKWVNEISEQLGDRSPEEVRADCKLRFGIPILRAGNELFREKYDRLIKPLAYEQKMELMAEPMDFPVTRLMTVRQKTAYLDAIYHHYAAQGVVLTQPDPATLKNAAKAA